MKRLEVDIVALQETRPADTGTLREKDYTFYWLGKGSDELRRQGVGFAVKNTLLGMVGPGSSSTARILTLRIRTAQCLVHLVSVATTPGAKGEFCESLGAGVRNIPSSEQLILGDLSGRVGADCDSWPSCLVQYDVDRMNENG